MMQVNAVAHAMAHACMLLCFRTRGLNTCMRRQKTIGVHAPWPVGSVRVKRLKRAACTLRNAGEVLVRLTLRPINPAGQRLTRMCAWCFVHACLPGTVCLHWVVAFIAGPAPFSGYCCH